VGLLASQRCWRHWAGGKRRTECALLHQTESSPPAGRKAHSSQGDARLWCTSMLKLSPAFNQDCRATTPSRPPINFCHPYLAP
jgi:hypothetical protein